jgi:hypothetical protein
LINAINDKIDELKCKTDNNSLRMLGEAVMFRLGYNDYKESYLIELQKELPEFVRFYLKGRDKKRNETTKKLNINYSENQIS